MSELFPDLADERRHLVHAHRCREAMVRRLTAIAAGDGAADEITQEYIEMVVADALADLAQPGAGEFFGRIDEEGGPRWYVGRRHIEDVQHDPVVVGRPPSPLRSTGRPCTTPSGCGCAGASRWRRGS